MFPPLRRDPSQVGCNDRFTPQEAAYYAARIESLLNGAEAFLERLKSQSWEGLCADPGEDCGTLEGEGIRCRAGKCSFWVTWEGRLLPCGMLPDQGADVFQVGFAEAWRQAREAAAESGCRQNAPAVASGTSAGPAPPWCARKAAITKRYRITAAG